MSSARGPKRAWTAERTAEAVKMLHEVRREVLTVSIRAPLGSAEYEALSAVMMVTARALRVFGYDVVGAPARSVLEARDPRSSSREEDS